ncbi:MAG: hypothetical protein H6647_02020 [Anaerolineales bacterium]|nr:hypothetical protein [Anaerolineales bacterium]
MATTSDREALAGVKDEYMYGFSMPEEYVFKSRRGLDHEIVDQISVMKNEPEWMRDFATARWTSSCPSQCPRGALT